MNLNVHFCMNSKEKSKNIPILCSLAQYRRIAQPLMFIAYRYI